MSKRNNHARSLAVGAKFIQGGPDRIEHPRWPFRGRRKNFDTNIRYVWGSRNRLFIKRFSGFRKDVP